MSLNRLRERPEGSGTTPTGAVWACPSPKGIVDMMGGNIRVESEENVGTRFIVELEFRPSGTDNAASSPRTEDRSSEFGDTDSGEDMAVFPGAMRTLKTGPEMSAGSKEEGCFLWRTIL